MKKIGYVLEAIPVIALGTFLSRIPRKMLLPLGFLGGRLLFRLDKRDKRWAYRNLDIIYKEAPLSRAEKDEILKTLFVNMATGALEYLQLNRIGSENFLDFVQAENYEVVHTALEKKKGVLAVCAHLGNWECLGAVSARLGYHVATVLKRQHNPYADRWLTKIRETKGGVKCFYLEKGLNHRISAHLKQNGILAILADQRDVSSSLAVPFFGALALTPDGPAKLHLWYEAPIVFAFSIKQGNGKYLLRFEGPYCFRGSGDQKKDCLNIMTFINRKFEAVVGKYPDQWLSLLTPRWEGCGNDPKHAEPFRPERVRP